MNNSCKMTIRATHSACIFHVAYGTLVPFGSIFNRLQLFACELYFAELSFPKTLTPLDVLFSRVNFFC